MIRLLESESSINNHDSSPVDLVRDVCFEYLNYTPLRTESYVINENYSFDSFFPLQEC